MEEKSTYSRLTVFEVQEFVEHVNSRFRAFVFIVIGWKRRYSSGCYGGQDKNSSVR